MCMSVVDVVLPIVIVLVIVVVSFAIVCCKRFAIVSLFCLLVCVFEFFFLFRCPLEFSATDNGLELFRRIQVR